MSRRLAALLIAASALLILAALLLVARSSRRGAEVDRATSSDSAGESGLAEGVAVELYFPGAGGLLYREERRVPAGVDAVEKARNIVTALIEGPETESLYPAFPDSTTLGAIDVGPQGSLYVSLDSPASPRLSLGSRSELLMVYSLVDSVVYNVPEVERVAVVWNGAQPPTLAGHVDTSRPLPPSRVWVAAGN